MKKIIGYIPKKKGTGQKVKIIESNLFIASNHKVTIIQDTSLKVFR